MIIESEVLRILKSKRTIFFICVMLIIPIIDLCININSVYGDYFTHREAYKYGLSSHMIMAPAIASFLSGTSQGHIPQMLLIWVLPLYLMIIYSDSYIQERKVGYNVIIFSQVSRKKIVTTRLSISFLVPFIISFVSMLLNFLLANIVFMGGEDLHGAQFMLGTGDMDSFRELCYNHLNLTYCIYIVVYSIIAGGVGLLCTCISFLIPQYKIAYPVAFLVWMGQVIAPYSITFAIQPFIEYGPEYFIPAIMIFLAILLCTMIIAIKYKVGYDEI